MIRNGIPEHWSAEQAVAVYEFISELQDLIWERYDDQIIKLLRPDLDWVDTSEIDQCDFDDEIPF